MDDAQVVPRQTDTLHCCSLQKWLIFDLKSIKVESVYSQVAGGEYMSIVNIQGGSTDLGAARSGRVVFQVSRGTVLALDRSNKCLRRGYVYQHLESLRWSSNADLRKVYEIMGKVFL